MDALARLKQFPAANVPEHDQEFVYSAEGVLFLAVLQLLDRVEALEARFKAEDDGCRAELYRLTGK